MRLLCGILKWLKYFLETKSHNVDQTKEYDLRNDEFEAKYRACPKCGHGSKLLGSTAGTYDYLECRSCKHRWERGYV
jgi:ribosomal protein S27AE